MVLGAAIVVLSALAIPQVMQLMQHNSTQAQAIRVSVLERAKIEALLKNHAAWLQTLSKNTNFGCGLQKPGCSPSPTNDGFYNFVLYGSEPGEKLTYDLSDPKTRVTLQGTHCPAGTPDPSEHCPIRFQAAWKPICAAYPCMNPTLQIKILLSTRYGQDPSKVIPMNIEKYSYSVVRSFNEDDIQSACFALGGVYNSQHNTCYPPHAGRTCALLGKPAQVVTGIERDGKIICAPVYHDACNPATQMMTGISATGAAICSPKPPPAPPSPAVNCVGNWGACSASCKGTQTYSITTSASGGGDPCPVAAGTTRECNPEPCPVNCIGEWQACTQTCGGGTSIFVVTTPAANGGDPCVPADGSIKQCNTQACGLPVDCAGTWSACDPNTGLETFSITQAPQNGGVACPASTRTCKVDCVGDWGVCSSGSPSSKTYTWTVTPKNGGATCATVNGAMDTAGCMTSCGWEIIELPGSCGGGNLYVTTCAGDGVGDMQGSEACSHVVDCDSAHPENIGKTYDEGSAQYDNLRPDCSVTRYQCKCP